MSAKRIPPLAAQTVFCWQVIHDNRDHVAHHICSHRRFCLDVSDPLFESHIGAAGAGLQGLAGGGIDLECDPLAHTGRGGDAGRHGNHARLL